VKGVGGTGTGGAAGEGGVSSAAAMQRVGSALAAAWAGGGPGMHLPGLLLPLLVLHCLQLGGKVVAPSSLLN
jgi:hypothetical protein